MKKLLNLLEAYFLKIGNLSSTIVVTLVIALCSLFLGAVTELIIVNSISRWTIVLTGGIPLILAPPFIYIFFQLLAKLHTLNQQLAHRANHDQLTGVFSRHYLLESINRELSRFSRHGNRFTVLFIDVDDFKAINDSFGHQIGDETLVVLAKSINSCLRDIDILGRYGGDEFLVCLPETNAIKAKVIAQRIQHALQHSLQTVNTHNINITASIGIYSPEDSAIDSEYIIEHADKAVYLAKMKGKNRIEIVE